MSLTSSISDRLRAASRDPLVIFALLAAALFGGYRFMHPDRQAIEVSPAVEASLFDDYTTLAGHRPDAAEQQKIIARYIDDEVLFQEALKRGIALSDKGVRQRLIERMRMDMAPEPAEPSEDELMAFYATHAQSYSLEPSISFDHVYFLHAPADPAAVLARLNAGEKVEGDDFWMGRDLPRYGRSMISAMFGLPFLDKLETLPQGRWVGPVASIKGTHFVRVNDRRPAIPRPYPEVRDLVLHDWKTAHADQALQSQLTRLRSRYRVSVAPVSGETPRESGPSTSNTP
ncbi:hypothetical protein Y88_2730 [Novosphingobium nitrogenifigens DSM 19370]|uniref:peptidylprolyl isomerase n=1 Tax=Novosphingobium nitrogenifigens DSM 19370 TaxID=983920 RepID=F1Z460_9SPHN|nr:peptidylprolyl isomerase [Novosphingobium nitrogenifigens]EGD60617.1 hypothetical protein Y88_2730 [Novosphingobium nitrogenifigens DSM 19370]